MRLDDRMRALIAVGASITANCQPCLEATTAIALESGADAQEITEAIDVGKRVRQGAASKMDRFASSLDGAASPPFRAEGGGCDCSS
jgi:AhpD family alkylhydroperoxidase